MSSEWTPEPLSLINGIEQLISDINTIMMYGVKNNMTIPIETEDTTNY